MEQTSNNKYHVTIKSLPNSQVEISAIISAEEFDKTRSTAVKHIGADITLPGFRKGHVPEKILSERLGEEAILEEMAGMAISRAYPEIVREHKIDALGRPEVRITKIAPGNPLEFTLTTAIFPDIQLPDYKKLATKTQKESEEIVVTDDELTKTIEQIQKMRAQNMAGEEGKAPTTETELPPLDDTFIKSLGNFDTVEAFKTQLRDNLRNEKERMERDKRRVAIMEAIISNTKLELPEIIVEQELHRMRDEFATEIERAGMTLEAYMKAVGKTEEEMHSEWRPDAIKRAKVQLITSKIAEVEKIEPDKEQLAQEGVRLSAQYPEANRERIEGYLEMLLTNEKVFQFLESQEG